VVVAGTHVVDQSQLDLSISELKCPADSAGNVAFPSPLPTSIACTVTGKNLNKAAKLKLEDSKNATDKLTAEGAVSVSGDSTNATVTFPAKDLICLSQPAYSVFAVSSAGAETSTGQTLHFVPGPYVSSLSPNPLDFSKKPTDNQSLDAAGCNLTSVAKLQLTTSDGKTTASFDNTVSPAAADKASFSIDPTKVSGLGTGDITLKVLDSSGKAIAVDTKLKITGLASGSATPAPAPPAPTVTAVTAPTAGTNSAFTITGTGFDATSEVSIKGAGCQASGAGPCTFAAAKLKITPATKPTQIQGTTNLPAGSDYSLTVQNGDKGTPSNAYAFAVKAAPASGSGKRTTGTKTTHKTSTTKPQ